MPKDKFHCKWKIENVLLDEGMYKTECDEFFMFITDGIKKNKFKYCPYCGRWIKEVKSDNA